MNRPPHPPRVPPAGATESQGGAPESGVASRIGPAWRRNDVLARTDAGPDSHGGDEDFDAITDLFLGETRHASPGQRASVREESSNTPGRPVQATPVLRLIRDEDDAVAIVPADVPSTRGPAADNDNEAAEFDGEAVWSGLPVPPPARMPVVECVVLGNLPMFAAAWANQHAREVAKAANKPVALLRLQGGYASVELFGAEAAGIAIDAEPATFEDAIDAACEATDRWMIRAEAGSEPQVLSHGLLRVLTVLTGADQMACEACRATLSRLAPALAEIDEANGPMVRIGIMGVAEGQSDATNVISNVVSTTLGREAPTFSSSGQIHSGRASRTLFSGPTERTIVELLDLLERTLLPVQMPVASPESTQNVAVVESQPSMPKGVEHVAVATVHEPEPELAIEPEVLDVAPLDDDYEMPLPEPTPSITEAIAGDVLAASDTPVIVPEPKLSAVEPVAEVRPVPMSTPAPAPIPVAAPVVSPTRFTLVPPAVAPEPTPAHFAPVPAPVPAPAAANVPSTGLARHVAGLIPLDVRCPYAPGVELAVDAAGVLHLFVRALSSTTTDSSLAELMIASSWSSLHAGLMAAGVGRTLHADRPVLHIMTDQPKHSRRLLDTSVRVHLLTRVDVGNGSGWCCVELN